MISFAPTPHVEALAFLRRKPALSREVFDGLLPELRGRAFTVTGLEGLRALERVRDEIATLPSGAKWDDVKESLVSMLAPSLDDAVQRAELLMRTHAFQAYQAATWRTAQEDPDTTHLQYLATEDGRVRASHIALNGLILPKDDPFWDTHTPPWDWGCRCRIRPMNPDMVDLERELDRDRNPEDKLVLEGPALAKLRQGTLIREGQSYDVTAPSERRESQNAFQWRPGSMRLSLEDLAAEHAPADWAEFLAWSAGQQVDGAALLDLLRDPPQTYRPQLAAAPAQSPLTQRPRFVTGTELGVPGQGEYRTAQQFARDRTRLEEAAQKAESATEGRKAARAAAAAQWKPRPLTPQEIAARLADLQARGYFQDMTPEPSGQGEAIPGADPAFIAKLEKLEAEERAELQRLAAIESIYYTENPDALDAIRDSLRPQRRDIIERYRAARKNL